jgi:hypothetical protein
VKISLLFSTIFPHLAAPLLICAELLPILSGLSGVRFGECDDGFAEALAIADITGDQSGIA